MVMLHLAIPSYLGYYLVYSVSVSFFLRKVLLVNDGNYFTLVLQVLHRFYAYACRCSRYNCRAQMLFCNTVILSDDFFSLQYTLYIYIYVYV